jgi:PAS domain S-box-containing protein
MKNAYPEIIDKGDSRNRKTHKADKDNYTYPSEHDNEFFHLLADNARDLITHATFIPTFHYDYVSPSSTNITGYTPEDFYADPFLAKKITLPEDYHLVEDISAWDISSKNKPAEIRWKRKDGTIIWTEQMISLTRDKDGVPTSFHVIARDVTERKQAETTLREIQQFNSSLLENAPHATVVINPDTSVKYVNPAWENINGWTLEEVEGRKSPYPWWPAEYQDVFVKGFEEAMKQGSGNSEVFAQKKNGDIYWISMNWVSVMNNGELAYMIINSVDITDRIKAQEALKESESKYRSIFESANDIIVLMDCEGTIVDINSKVKEIAGFDREELIGRKLSLLTNIMSKNTLLSATKTLDKRLSGESIAPYELEMRKKNGEPIYFEVNAVPLKVNDKISGDVSILRDITNQKRSMLALKESEEKFSKAFIASPNPVCIVTVKEGTFLEVNESYLRFSGYSREEVIGHTPVELNLWVREEDTKKMAKSLQETGKLDNYEIKSRMKSGEIRTGLFSAEEIEIGGKKCITLVITDITEQIKVTEALEESEEKFSRAFNGSPSMMVIVNINENKYTEVNDSFANCLGYTREEIIGHSPKELNLWVYPEEATRMTQWMEKNGKLRDEEFRFRTKSGDIRTWLCSADTLTIGGVLCMLAVSTDITERKKNQEALRESEEKFSKAFQASPSSVSISRISDGKFIEVNDTFLRNKGYTRKEVIGRKSRELNIFADKEDHAKIRAMLKSQGKFTNLEMQYHMKSDELRTGLISAEVINIGNEPCMIVINTDITKQKEAEAQLRLLSSVTQQVSDSTVIVDPDYKITYINKAAENMFGYTLDEVRGKKLSIFNKVSPSDEIKKEIAEALKAGKTHCTIVPKKHKDGTTIICDCRLSPLYDEKGQINSLINVLRDITKQTEVEAKLQEHKKLIDSILATTPEGVLVIDSNDRILLANKALFKIFHFNRRSLKNKLFSEIFPIDQFLDLQKAVKLGENEKQSLEFRYKAQSLEKIIDCVAVKMDGERILLIFSDISREREEEEKLYLTDRLASIGEMAAGLAHELNNPLTGIITLSQLLMGSNLPKEDKEDIECINSEAKRAASIVKNVLLFARNRTGENSQASVNEVLKDVLRLREYEEKTNNISVVTNLEENLPDIPLDKGQLQQVFLNLISNAEAAIKEANRPGTITMKTQRSNNHINMIFSDNGCGIKKQIMHRIFDPFFTTKEIGKGTGLGLSICYSIIVKHGGKLSVKSQVNEGATFTIRMPVVM